MICFSFSLYGKNPKYTTGMIENAELIYEHYPQARIQIYIADDVPADIREFLSLIPTVRFVNVPVERGTLGTFNRFLAIDDHDCDVMIVRDADSRVHARDRACIDDFLASNRTLLVIRDHCYHEFPIMGGMWGMRKTGQSMRQLVTDWRAQHANMTEYTVDQQFLAQVIYPRYITNALIFDRYDRHEHPAQHTPFRIPIVDKLFVGQVHENGVPVFDP